MKPIEKRFTAVCACGKVAFQADGEPMLRLLCHCDDCQAANAMVDALPHGKSGRTPEGGTDSTLFRRDRVSCVRGQELLRGLKLRPDAITTRMLATCCNSLVGNYFSNWLPHVALRTFSAETPTVAPKFRIFTKFASDNSRIPADVPHYTKFPISFALQLVGMAVQLKLRGNPKVTFEVP
jgi:hypothetical protein